MFLLTANQTRFDYRSGVTLVTVDVVLAQNLGPAVPARLTTVSISEGAIEKAIVTKIQVKHKRPFSFLP